MFGALSIVPAVGRGIAMVTPVPWSYYLLGANHLPLIGYVHDSPKSRLEVTPLLANTHIPCQAQTCGRFRGESWAARGGIETSYSLRGLQLQIPQAGYWL